VRDVKLRLPEVVFLFVLGGIAALIGDYSHVTELFFGASARSLVAG